MDRVRASGTEEHRMPTVISDLIYCLSLLIKNPFSKMLEKQILMTVGMPSSLLPDRYNKKC